MTICPIAWVAGAEAEPVTVTTIPAPSPEDASDVGVAWARVEREVASPAAPMPASETMARRRSRVGAMCIDSCVLGRRWPRPLLRSGLTPRGHREFRPRYGQWRPALFTITLLA